MTGNSDHGAGAAMLRAPRFLGRARSIAAPGFNRWLVPPCALAIHLCIGMSYGFSVFWLPLSRAIGISAPRACPDLTLAMALTTTVCDWRVSDLVWIYTLFFVVLGASAALWGGWVEREGPRRAAMVAACCWCGGMAIAAVGIALHQLWLVWLGVGVIGGIGLGLGYISPVSTLVKWFPDRRGMATGMAIMGFGGGAMIGSPLADWLMGRFAGPGGVGVWQTLLVLAAGYGVFMTAGALGYRVLPPDWTPPNWSGPKTPADGAAFHVPLQLVHRTPQFWLIWLVLLLNVSASIGIIGLASPMLQEVFGGRLVGADGLRLTDLDAGQQKAAAAMGAGFVGLISLFNIGGRFFWASLSDRLGRKPLYGLILMVGALLYGLGVPAFASASLGLFVLAFCVIASMYGGGFAAVPAYLADTFGTRFVGAVHGRLLTAWSVAGVLGPLLVAYMRDARIAAGAAGAGVYQPIFMAMAAMLLVGLVINQFVRPVKQRFRVAETPADAAGTAAVVAAGPAGAPSRPIIVAAAWALVGLPLAAGAAVVLGKAMVLLG
ncbi:OFA family MFS transporter [Sandarakinorhabdus sp.]|uniref:OFA family MFS transporter n=1 Tax=Sandarakinorhabdus sp. TaxID=1916663 RepID=UPI00286E9495|nr:OFA family MFS transporter [Sandarakinorhabdus sp.]